jgi:murein DD-endopeptidase MepM/ murein hydrolase activator NlpD
VFAVDRLRLVLWLAAAIPLVQDFSAADELYKYRDANGNLVYSDRKPDSGTATVESLAVGLESKAPRIEVHAVSSEDKWQLVATNECQCVVEFGGQIIEAHNLNVAEGQKFHRVLAPRSQQTLLEVAHPPGNGAPAARLAWRGILGEPGAQHNPAMPYRAPFALGASYKVSQAYPSRFTHTTTADQYAVDFVLPDGTPVDAAREGTVINVRHDRYLGAPTPEMMDQANMVEILHDDGTIAIYAHLHWDSVRVQPGQHVRRGEYIANSGNTGFSTGAHLHFAVIRNSGMSAESLPVQFAGPGGTAITAQTNSTLTAY